jgi:hypothetical protein
MEVEVSTGEERGLARGYMLRAAVPNTYPAWSPAPAGLLVRGASHNFYVRAISSYITELRIPLARGWSSGESPPSDAIERTVRMGLGDFSDSDRAGDEYSNKRPLGKVQWKIANARD